MISSFSLRNDESLAGGDEPKGDIVPSVPSVPDRDNTAVSAISGGSSVTGSHVLPRSSTTGPGRTHSIHDTTLRSGASRPSTSAAVTSTRQCHGNAHGRSTISASSTSSRQYEGVARGLSSTAVIPDDRGSTTVGDGLRTGVGGDGGASELVDGEVDLENFEDFDDDLYDEMEMEIEGGGGKLADTPGHREWPLDNDSQNDFQLQGRNAGESNFSIKRNTCSSETVGVGGNLERSASHSHSSRVESDAPKSKLSLRQQKSSKTRVCELEHGGRGERGESQRRMKNPPVASVKPIQQRRQQQLPQDREKQRGSVAAPSCRVLTESELYEEPVVLKSIPEVENNSWKLRPFVKIKVGC